jgi:XTP/dITP diphosphohydrolase
VIALVHPAGDEHLAEGICPGEIIPEERGLNGFGYDPIFWLPDLKMTMAELTMPEKNKRSHRAQAVLAARPKLIEWLQQRG